MPNTSASGGYLYQIDAVPLDDLTLDRKISNYLAGVSGITGSLVRPRWQAEPPPVPEPDANWAAFGVTHYVKAGSPFILHVRDGDVTGVGDDVGLDRMFCNWDLTVQASFYGPNCGAYVRRLCDGLEEWQNHETATSFGLHIREIGDPIATAEKFNEVWYRRADVSLTIRHKFTRDYAVLNILQANGLVSAEGDSPSGPVEVGWNTEVVSMP